MRRCPQHIFQILTKRADQMDLMTNACGIPRLPNLWLGITAEDWQRADERIPLLLQTHAAIRFVSVEPMLEPVPFARDVWTVANGHSPGWLKTEHNPNGIDWVIIGCESGPNRRSMELQWAIDLVEQCKAASVPVFVKQIPINGKVSKNPEEWPQVLRVREYPTTEAR